jgi:two-component system cell cycle sensor histidine kinase/response regulator CckA
VERTKPLIALVEDEMMIADLAVHALEGAGYEVVSAPTGAAALGLLNDRPIDLLIVDVALAGGMDGIAVARHARRIFPTLPIIFTSGRTLPKERSEIHLLGVMMRKPFALPTLIATVKQLLGG